MMNNAQKPAKTLVLLLAAGLVLLFVSGVTSQVFASTQAFPLKADGTATPTPTDSAGVGATSEVNPHLGGDCLDCHGKTNLVGKAMNGETVSLYVHPEEHQGSFHSRVSGGCTTYCHQDQSIFPHKDSTAESCIVCHWKESGEVLEGDELVFNLPYTDVRAITLEVNQSCQKCHTEIFETTTDSAHTRIMEEGNRYAPVCSDCHSGHDISLVNREDISAVCKKCHLAEYSTYKGSVHGDALETDSNPDVPTCANCHGSHLVNGPATSNFREEMVGICGDCHADKSIMDKYGISTDVLSTYMDDAHGLTDWFRKTNLENITRATCFDCHGKHNILKPDNPASKVYPENLQATCQQCHEDASIRFPKSWLSHKRIGAEENAGLNLVNIIAWVVVIVVVVVVLFFIFLDMRKRAALRKQSKAESQE